jgi:hypothetical protein
MKHATGQTYREGAALILTAGETLEAADAAGAVNAIGFAAEDADPNNTDSRAVDVHPGDGLVAVGHPGATFLMEIWASAARVDPIQADVGATFGLAKDAANGAWYVNRDDTTNGAVIVVNIVPKDAVPAQKGPGEPAAIMGLVEVKLVNPYG